ncbi:adenylate/guanylate cyclase domain-containing protein [Mucilaginibacter sp.]|jgi:class 3 adenylate cyclase|uniref:adenylate/guanylate cyclase domain-containing protein n=1 Tax=Mucilaginibacter sp. TaxID=1882438 RepID=UPI0035619566
MPSPKARRAILRIIPFGMLWLVFSMVYTLLERGLLGNLHYYPSTGNTYVFARNIFMIPLLALITGTSIGVLEIFYFSKWFIKKSFTKKILYKSLIYLVIVLLFLVLTFITTANFAITRKDIWSGIWAFFTDYSLLSVLIYIACIIVVTQFYTEVSESIGTAVLANFFLGKYHRPVEEERIFMFLDMRSSTEIAEKLGHVKYFEMLKEYFSDLSEPVIDYGGEIYQYAGDEMIVSWKLKNGLKNNNCIRCFFAMKESINKKADKYKEKFGVLPQFKAGFHYGKVTTGEIGVLKKEIIFTGDVLNTTARIQGLCNQLNVDILISDALIKKMDLDPSFQITSLGETQLRGRGEKIELFAIS